MYVEDKYAKYHYVAIYRDGLIEPYQFYKDSIKRVGTSQLSWNHKTLHYLDLDLLESKDTILQMMYSNSEVDRELAYEILKTNGCITERK